MKLLILSDIHGNVSAFKAVLSDVKSRNASIEAAAILGDIIDYGMHSNEAVEMCRQIGFPVVCNIWGNHEHSIINEEYSRFSSDRGRVSAKHTRSQLNDSAWDYLENTMARSGKTEFMVGDKKFLAVHGSLQDIYWKSISPETAVDGYEAYDYVLSGHSHYPHFFERYAPADDPDMRNRKKVIFINPGSVGQPRNHNSRAQYAILDTESEEIQFCKVAYDIGYEQKAFDGSVDDFYRARLEKGV